jgi:hypothetical protein
VDEIAPLLHRLLGLDDGAQRLQLRQAEIDETAQARDERIAAPDILGGAGGASRHDRAQGNVVHLINLDQ